jgi:hypothetical protein
VFEADPSEWQRDRTNPTIWAAFRSDPTMSIDPDVRTVLVRDQQRWSRRYIRPAARVVSRVAVAMIIVLKRVLPFQFNSHKTIDKLCIWFMRRFVSQDAAWLLLRHFIVETNLINFVARNCGDGTQEVDLKPTAINDLNNSAVILHDLNMYNLIIDLGESASFHALEAGIASRVPIANLDFSMLTVPPLDAEPQFRRWMNLDLETALCFMNIAFCFFTSENEYERAINSLQLDESLMAILTGVTGDVIFRTWRPIHPMAVVSIARDVPRELYWHAVIDEYAHGRLLKLKARADAAVDSADNALDAG